MVDILDVFITYENKWQDIIEHLKYFDSSRFDEEYLKWHYTWCPKKTWHNLSADNSHKKVWKFFEHLRVALHHKRFFWCVCKWVATV